MGFKKRISFNPKRRLQAAGKEIATGWLKADYGGNIKAMASQLLKEWKRRNA